MYKLRLDKVAEGQRDQILEYIVQEFDNPVAAKRLELEFKKGFAKIKQQPYICPVFQTENSIEVEYRKLIVKNCAAFYHVEETQKLITVARIFHMKQNYEKDL